VTQGLSRLDDFLATLNIPPKGLSVASKDITDLTPVYRHKGHPMDAKSVTGLEVQAAPEHFWLKAGLIVECDNVAGQMATTPGLLDDSDLGVADESGTYQELQNEWRYDK
jgi:hypothetical protein